MGLKATTNDTAAKGVDAPSPAPRSQPSAPPANRSRNNAANTATSFTAGTNAPVIDKKDIKAAVIEAGNTATNAATNGTAATTANGSTTTNAATNGAGATTSNTAEGAAAAPTASENGASTQELRTSEFDGKRDAQIQEYKDKLRDLRVERASLRTDIAKLDDEIAKDQLIAGAAGWAVDKVTGGAENLAALVGINVDIDGAAEAATGRLLGLDQERRDLSAKEQSLADQEKALTETIEQLENERVMNSMVSALWTAGASEEIVNAVDGGTRPVEVIATDDPRAQTMEGDAVYNDKTDSIQVLESFIDSDPAKGYDQLLKDGIIDVDGNVVNADVNAAQLDASLAADRLLVAGTLIGVHETAHADQQAAGLIAATRSEIGTIDPALTTADPSAAALSRANAAAEFLRVGRLELEAYRLQEQANRDVGVFKKSDIYLTRDAAGTPLNDPLLEMVRIINYTTTGNPGSLDEQRAQLAKLPAEVRLGADASRDALLQLATALADPSSALAQAGVDFASLGLLPGAIDALHSYVATEDPGKRPPPGELTPGKRPPPGEGLLDLYASTAMAVAPGYQSWATAS